jgi:hypothetical protein
LLLPASECLPFLGLYLALSLHRCVVFHQVSCLTEGRITKGGTPAHTKNCLLTARRAVLWRAQELGRSPFPVVRNNIMVALSDMLIQYTALVDAHMPRLAGCIRWGGALFFSFLFDRVFCHTHEHSLCFIDPLRVVRALKVAPLLWCC